MFSPRLRQLPAFVLQQRTLFNRHLEKDCVQRILYMYVSEKRAAARSVRTTACSSAQQPAARTSAQQTALPDCSAYFQKRSYVQSVSFSVFERDTRPASGRRRASSSGNIFPASRGTHDRPALDIRRCGVPHTWREGHTTKQVLRHEIRPDILI